MPQLDNVLILTDVPGLTVLKYCPGFVKRGFFNDFQGKKNTQKKKKQTEKRILELPRKFHTKNL